MKPWTEEGDAGLSACLMPENSKNRASFWGKVKPKPLVMEVAGARMASSVEMDGLRSEETDG